MTDDVFDGDPARILLHPADYRHVGLVAADVVRLYGEGGPPFPILRLFALLQPFTRIESSPLTGREPVYGYSFALDFARHRKHAALFLDMSSPAPEVFITAFHEAGHILLHILPPQYQTEVSHARLGGPGPRPGTQAEVEADLFARLTTMPSAWVYAAWPYACAATGTADEAIAWMAALFSVPWEWMRLRLASLGLPADR